MLKLSNASGSPATVSLELFSAEGPVQAPGSRGLLVAPGTTRSVTLPKHPSPELWSVGTHVLEVRDGTSSIIATTNLVVTP